MSQRSWGDGATLDREHVVTDCNMGSRPGEHFIVCSCGTTLFCGPFVTIGHAWQDHTGRVVDIPPLRERATDSEVHEFLLAIEDPHYVTPLMWGTVTRGVPDLEDAWALMNRLLEIHYPSGRILR